MKILLVDDNSNFRSLLKDILIDDAIFWEASNGKDALNLIMNGFCPDLALIDINMRELNGYQMVRQLRANPKPEISGLKIIFLTSHDIEKYRTEAETLGCAFLCKSYQNNRCDSEKAMMFVQSSQINTKEA